MAVPFKEFSKTELNSARFLHLRICTSGLDNPKEGDEAFDYSNACPECKAGRIGRGELHLKSSKMGQKKIDMNFRYGIILFENDLIEEVISSDLKGIEFLNCSLGTERSKFKEGRIVNTFPKYADKAIVHTEDVCKTCGKSGHYDAQNPPTEFWHLKKDLDLLKDDFYLTWEYYGIWDKGQTYPLPIVSQKFRQVLINKYKLRHLRFEPIQEQE